MPSQVGKECTEHSTHPNARVLKSKNLDILIIATKLPHIQAIPKSRLLASLSFATASFLHIARGRILKWVHIINDISTSTRTILSQGLDLLLKTVKLCIVLLLPVLHHLPIFIMSCLQLHSKVFRELLRELECLA